MVIGANPTTHTVPRRPALPGSYKTCVSGQLTQCPAEHWFQSHPDTLTRLADLMVGMNTKQATQTLMVRTVSTTTLTFKGIFEKI